MPPERLRGQKFKLNDPNLYKGEVWPVGLIMLEACLKRRDHFPKDGENIGMWVQRVLDESQEFE